MRYLMNSWKLYTFRKSSAPLPSWKNPPSPPFLLTPPLKIQNFQVPPFNSLNMDNSKSDTVSLELNTYTKQEICVSRASGLILKNMCAISS